MRGAHKVKLVLIWVWSESLNQESSIIIGQINFSVRPPVPAQQMYSNLVVVSFMIYISSRFEKEINKTWGLFHVWPGLYANLLAAFFSFVFLFLLACGPTWVLGIWGFWGFGWFILFLIISFSRFQYFNFHFGSLKLCFTNLVLEIQDNLSLIFLSSVEISNLIYFTHFRLSAIIMGHISKFKPRFVQYAKVMLIFSCQSLIQSKTIRL